MCAVGRELGIRYIVERSVRNGGNRVRICGRLIDASDGKQLWRDRFDRELADIFALQDEITLTLTGAIEPDLSRTERDRAHRRAAENLDA